MSIYFDLNRYGVSCRRVIVVFTLYVESVTGQGLSELKIPRHPGGFTVIKKRIIIMELLHSDAAAVRVFRHQKDYYT